MIRKFFRDHNENSLPTKWNPAGLSTTGFFYFAGFLGKIWRNFLNFSFFCIDPKFFIKTLPIDLMNPIFDLPTVKPLIMNTSEEFMKCGLDNFSMSFILYYVNFSICENK